MAAKRKSLRAPSTRSQFTAVLEAIEQQSRLAMEAAASNRVALERQIAEFRSEVEARFEILESAILDLGLRVKTLEIKIGTLELVVQNNTEELRSLKKEIAHLTEISRGKVEARDVAALAERVARLEARIGL